MSLDSSIDPDIAEAFSGQTSAISPQSHIDDDVAAAFPDAQTKTSAKQTDISGLYNPLKPITEGIVGAGETLLAGATSGVGSLADALTFSPPGTHNWGYQPRTEAGKETSRIAGKAFNAANEVAAQTGGDIVGMWGGNAPAATQTLRERIPEALGATGTVAGIGGLARSIVERPAAVPVNPQDVVDTVTARQSGGAAGAAPNVATASPEIKAKIAATDPANADPVAMNNHLEADRFGVQLTKGAANRDPVQYSEEQNRSTDPRMAARIAANNEQLTNAIDDVRREASPTTVANSPRENGQMVVDDLKAYDEPIRADIKAKYQKLEDANGGSIPIDTGTTISNIDARLKKGSLTRTAGADPAVSEVMDNLRTGQPIDFESFESARSLLAGVQRKGGSAGTAAGIVRDELEKMPLPPEAQPLKALADDARSAASARFAALKADPAYEAAVDDIANGNTKGKPSPLSDTFLDDYALNRGAPKSQVDLMMQKLTDEGKGAVASHTLGAIRKSAVGRTGSVLPSGYNGAMEKYGDKLDSLIKPETQDDLESLGRVINNVKSAPQGSSIAPKSGVIVRNAIEGVKGGLEGLVNAKTGGAYGFIKGLMPSNDQFVEDALSPGAGIDKAK